MKQISLTQGKYALVDDKDFGYLNQWKWFASFDGCNWYACRKGGVIKMHRVILGLQKGDKQKVDHINHNGLDNCRCNLRICTQAQNCQNRKPYKNSSSKYKGVSWYSITKKWRARIKLKRKEIHLGYFDSETLAAKTYDEKAKILFGDFAKLNFER